MKCRKLDAVRVKGKKKPQIIYELIADKKNQGSSYDISFNNLLKADKEDKSSKFIKEYEEALELYFKKYFEKALKKFKGAISIRNEDKSCELFIERCKEYIKSPPAKEWDGVFEMKEK